MSLVSPPRWLDRILEWYCSEELLEEIHGDLHEAYEHRVAKSGKIKANWWYFLDVLQFFRPYSFEKYSGSKQYLPMFSNYIKIASRNLIKRKGYTALNLLGLSIGLSAVMLVGIYLQHEHSYDQIHPQSESIHRLVNNYRDQTYNCMFFSDYYQSDQNTQLLLLNHLKAYEEIEVACHFVPTHSPIGSNAQYYVEAGGKKLFLDKFLYTNTGAEFQSVFPQEYLLGTTQTSYSDFGTVTLTETTAEKLYGKDWAEQEILNSSLRMQDETFLVGGVIADVPGNVHYDFNLIIHDQLIPSWGAYTYVKLKEGGSIEQVLTRLNAETDALYPGYSEDVLQKGISSIPLQSIHFTGGNLYELKPNANEAYLGTFGIVALVMLLIIWTNYTNLSIAMYAGRQKELGIRKLMGARITDISLQIMIEAILLTLMCLPIAWGLVYFALPFFNEWMEVVIGQEVLYQSSVLLVLTSAVLLTGAISGLYPALVFGNKSMVGLFDGKLNEVKSRGLFNFRNALLTIQFFFLIGLLSITLMIRQQMDYVQNRDLGFNQEGVLYFGMNGKEKYQRLKQELKQLPGVKEVGTGMIPGMEMYNQLTYQVKNSDVTLSDGTLIYTSLDALKVLGIDSEAFVSLENGQDSVLIVNQTAAKKLANVIGVSAYEMIGETLVTEPEWENEDFGYGQHYMIADVIDDFDYFSLRYPSQSLIMEVRRESEYVYNALVSIEPEGWFETVSAIEAAYLKVEKELPFDAMFLDDHLQQLYSKELSAGLLATSLTGICIVLAVMGLLGIVGFVTQSRKKEMGIRKVFGATTLDILLTINRSYVVLIVISTAIAVPTALYLGQKWLENFAYRITPSVATVILAGGITLALVVVLVVIQSFKTARINPSDTLRYE